MRQHNKVSIELPVTTRHRRDMTDNVESDVKPEQTNKQTYKPRLAHADETYLWFRKKYNVVPTSCFSFLGIEM